MLIFTLDLAGSLLVESVEVRKSNRLFKIIVRQFIREFKPYKWEVQSVLHVFKNKVYIKCPFMNKFPL